jgi:hypothetical protein
MFRMVHVTMDDISVLNLYFSEMKNVMYKLTFTVLLQIA